MDYQSFVGIMFLSILIINSSLTLAYPEEAMNQFDEHHLEGTSDEYDDMPYKPRSRRDSELGYARGNAMNQQKKARGRFLTYDFLLHRWVLRKARN